MSVVLGIDTSNYTTSAALYDSVSGEMVSAGQLLDVAPGEKGLQQSKALFLHTRQLPSVLEDAFTRFSGGIPNAVCVSDKPRSVNGSYMPVFTAGVSAASASALSLGVPLYKTSHQNGHIAAALYSVGRLDLIDRDFMVFHVSGGTTEAIYVTPSETDIFNCEIAARTLDLNAGQVIDRVGVKMGLMFPCGNELDRLSETCNDEIKVPKPALKGTDCCLSGLENLCDKFSKTHSKAQTASFLFSYLSKTIEEMSDRLHEIYGDIPFVYAGGVMRNSTIRKNVDGYFAEPQFSSDNAAGVAVIASILHSRKD